MSNYSDIVHARALETLANTEPTPEELAEQAERARRNKIDRIMAEPRSLTDASGASPGRHVPATLGEITSGIPGDEFGTKKWVRSQIKTVCGELARATGECLGKRLAAVIAEVEQGKRATDAVGRQVDKILTELAVLKRDAELEKKLEVQRTKRRAELLEIQLLAAGRVVPDECVEDELPHFKNWRGQHAQ